MTRDRCQVTGYIYLDTRTQLARVAYNTLPRTYIAIDVTARRRRRRCFSVFKFCFHKNNHNLVSLDEYRVE